METCSSDATCSTSQDSSLAVFGIERLYENLFSVLSSPKESHQKCQIQELQETKKRTEKELNEARIVLSEYHKIVDVLLEEYENLKKLSEAQTTHGQVISQKKAELEKEYNLLQQSKVNSHDEELVEKTKFQYKCVRDMTQVRFTLNKSNADTLEGYVFNKTTKKITNFSINMSETDNNQVQDRLLKLMINTSHPAYADISLE